jgi:membrane associated rhomboid family serine protease
MGSLGPEVFVRNQFWRAVTYVLLHEERWHMIANTYVLAHAGAVVESAFGSANTLCMIITGATLGNVAVMIADLG